MKVCYVFRAPRQGANSLEKTFKLVTEYADYEYEYVYLPKNRANLSSILKNISYCRKLSKKNDYDVYHITGDTNYVAIGLPAKKTVLTLHDLGVVLNNKGIKNFIAKKLWFGIPVKKCMEVTAISQKTVNELYENVPAVKNKKLSIVPAPIPSDYSVVEHGFNSVKPVILQVGTKDNKNLVRLAEALKGVDCSLRIIGKLKDEQKEALEKNSIDYSNDFDISDEQMKEEYRKADIVAFVSLYEGFGMIVAEAQAMGKALITSRLEPMLSIAGEKACLADPYNVEEIRENILKLINDTEYRNEIIKAGIDNAEQFRASIVAQKYKEVYMKINN